MVSYADIIYLDLSFDSIYILVQPRHGYIGWPFALE